MSDKRLLIVLTLLAVYVFGVRPISEKIPYEMFILSKIRKAISEEKFISNRAEDIKKLFPKYMKVAERNKRLFFSPDISTSKAMSNIQLFLRKISSQSGIQITRINWGADTDKGDYIVLPISLTIKGTPPQIGVFLKDLINFKKLSRFDSVSIYASDFSRYISFNTIIKFYKLKRKQQ